MTTAASAPLQRMLGGSGQADPTTSDIVRRAEDYLHAHSRDDINVTDLAAACEVTPHGRFAAAYRHSYGQSPSTTLRA